MFGCGHSETELLRMALMCELMDGSSKEETGTIQRLELATQWKLGRNKDQRRKKSACATENTLSRVARSLFIVRL